MFLFHRDCVVNILFFRQHMDTLQTHLIHKPETSLIYDTRCVACNKKCIYKIEHSLLIYSKSFICLKRELRIQAAIMVFSGA